MTDSGDIKRRLKHREDMFLRRLFGMLGKMAKADGKVDAWETHAAEGAFARWPRAAARHRFCVKAYNAGKDGRATLYRMAWDFANNWATPEDCLAVYGLFWDIACSTGVLKGAHKAELRRICKYLNLPERYFDIYLRQRQGSVREESADEFARAQAQRTEERMRSKAQHRAESRRRAEERRRAEAAREEARQREYRRSAWEWFRQHAADEEPPRSRACPRSPLAAEYELLGCSCDAADDVVRRAYRAAAKRCHPDLLRARGATEAELRQATAKMAQFNVAWEKIRKVRGL